MKAKFIEIMNGIRNNQFLHGLTLVESAKDKNQLFALTFGMSRASYAVTNGSYRNKPGVLELHTTDDRLKTVKGEIFVVSSKEPQPIINYINQLAPIMQRETLEKLTLEAAASP